MTIAFIQGQIIFVLQNINAKGKKRYRQQQGGNSVLLPLVRKTNLEPYSQTHSQYSPWLRKQNEDCTKHHARLCHHRDLSMLEHIIMQILGSLHAIETLKSVYIFLLLSTGKSN